MADAGGMRRRAILTLTLLPCFANAQPAQRGSVTPGQGRPDPSAQRRAELDRLFEALKDAPDAPGAQLVESRIRAVWAQAVSPAAGLLLRRGVRNLNGNSADEALEDFDAALILEPGAADLWLMRARAYAQLGDRAGAARDLREALRLEPRHFGAMLQLSELLDEAGDAAGALRMLDAVLALHPKMPTGEQRRRELQRKAEGDAL
jgi:tetratricopeptide (TPR) repeat protein